MPHPVARYYTVFLLISIIVVALDQLTKSLAMHHLSNGFPVDALPVLQWYLVFNAGVAFGLFGDGGGMQHLVLSVLTVGICLFIAIWLWCVCNTNKFLAWGLSLILGGAVGNLIDRLRVGQVIDFINLHYNNWYFPAFNIADMSITLGAVFLIADAIDSLRGQGKG